VRSRGKDDTIQAVLDAPDREALLGWLRTRPLMHVENGFAMVHAGLLPGWTVSRREPWPARWRALAGPYHADLLNNMWGSEPAAWRDDLRDYERMRVIVNAMTRMRFCTPEGIMDFKVKGGGSRPQGLSALVRGAGAQECRHDPRGGALVCPGAEDRARPAGPGFRCLWGGS
jgi:bis(5'-nucleosyl)-tetraphosphatase (symmetrical)